jgi:uncharacterized protein (TIGR02646 family)
MIYIEKQREVPAEFRDAVQGLSSYEDLPRDEKTTVIKILLEEQGGLCAFCEQKSDAFGPTIEHFLPQSVFPHLQLDYHNLCIICNKCNNLKGAQLIPAYIFDPRMDPVQVASKEVPLPRFVFGDGACKVVVPDPKKGDASFRWSAFILDGTLELMEQNRPRLTKARQEVYLTFLESISKLPKATLEKKWAVYQVLPKNAPHDEFFSLRCQLLKQALKIR